jgi:DtxR family Mn-dependent transcriptional regulator
LGDDVVLSNTQQDYIKAIWRLEEKLKPARMKTVAEEIGVKPPTVSAMFQQLTSLDLIMYDRRTGARLTRKGKTEAERVIRNHRLIETFLKKVLNLEEPLLHGEAEKLEHVISDQVIMKIDEYLGFPSTDPHGSVIPMSGNNDVRYRLAELQQETEFRIVSIPDSREERNFCADNGFVPGGHWVIKQIDPRGDSFLISNGEKYLAMSVQLAQKIKVNLVQTKSAR